MRFLAVSVLLATTGVGVFAIPQTSGKPPGGGGKSGGAASGNGGPTGLGALLGSDARPGTGCAKLEVLVARGTFEPGPYGVIVGDPLVAAVRAKVPGARGYAVHYPADASATSKSSGVSDTLKRLNQQAKECPGEKFALVGYSQGASVMHSAAPQIDGAVAQKIIAFVMYGDPGRRAGLLSGPLKSKVFENCAQGDFCGNSTHDGQGSGHLSYGTGPFHSTSAAFIAAAFNGTPQPARP